MVNSRRQTAKQRQQILGKEKGPRVSAGGWMSGVLEDERDLTFVPEE
jgi:hypothetical protein